MIDEELTWENVECFAGREVFAGRDVERGTIIGVYVPGKGDPADVQNVLIGHNDVRSEGWTLANGLDFRLFHQRYLSDFKYGWFVYIDDLTLLEPSQPAPDLSAQVAALTAEVERLRAEAANASAIIGTFTPGGPTYDELVREGDRLAADNTKSSARAALSPTSPEPSREQRLEAALRVARTALTSCHLAVIERKFRADAPDHVYRCVVAGVRAIDAALSPAQPAPGGGVPWDATVEEYHARARPAPGSLWTTRPGELPEGTTLRPSTEPPRQWPHPEPPSSNTVVHARGLREWMHVTSNGVPSEPPSSAPAAAEAGGGECKKFPGPNCGERECALGCNWAGRTDKGGRRE